MFLVDKSILSMSGILLGNKRIENELISSKSGYTFTHLNFKK